MHFKNLLFKTVNGTKNQFYGLYFVGMTLLLDRQARFAPKTLKQCYSASNSLNPTFHASLLQVTVFKALTSLKMSSLPMRRLTTSQF